MFNYSVSLCVILTKIKEKYFTLLLKLTKMTGKKRRLVFRSPRIRFRMSVWNVNCMWLQWHRNEFESGEGAHVRREVRDIFGCAVPLPLFWL